MDTFEAQPIAIDGHSTVPALFWHRVQTRPDKVAMREKDRGIWKAYTWAEYGDNARAIGMGLISLGLEPGDAVAILSDNNKEWLFCDLGVLCAAGISTGIYPTDSPAQVEYLVNDCKAKFLFVEDEEQLDKILAVRERTPHLKKIVVFDMEGLREFKDAQVMPLAELTALGKAYEKSQPAGVGAAHGPPEARRRRHHRLHLGHHGPLERRAAHPSQHHFPGQRLQARRPRHSRHRRGAEFPAAVPRRRAVRRLLQSHRLDACGQFRRGPRYGAAEPARGGAAHAACRAARVGEALLRRHHRPERGHAARAARLQGRNRHRHAGERLRAGRQAGAGPPARRARRGRLAGAQEHSRHSGPRPHPLRRHRRRADLAGSDPLVLGARHPHVRGLRPDRERGSRHLQLSRPHQDRHHRHLVARNGGQTVAAGRNPAARAAHLPRLPQQAGQDRRGPARRLAAHRRCGRCRQRRLRAHHRPHEGHHHHGRRQERHAVARSRTS